jgi:hypothetical protein
MNGIDAVFSTCASVQRCVIVASYTAVLGPNPHASATFGWSKWVSEVNQTTPMPAAPQPPIGIGRFRVRAAATRWPAPCLTIPAAPWCPDLEQPDIQVSCGVDRLLLGVSSSPQVSNPCQPRRGHRQGGAARLQQRNTFEPGDLNAAVDRRQVDIPRSRLPADPGGTLSEAPLTRAGYTAVNLIMPQMMRIGTIQFSSRSAR